MVLGAFASLCNAFDASDRVGSQSQDKSSLLFDVSDSIFSQSGVADLLHLRGHIPDGCFTLFRPG